MRSTLERIESLNSTKQPRRLALAAAAPFLAGVTLVACTPGVSPNASATTITVTKTSESSPSVTASANTATASATTALSTSPAKVPGLAGCEPYFDTTKYVNHEYEVCTAYVVNSAQIALQGFYKFGNNRASYASDLARHHFETRYWDQPRQNIEQRVDSWPKTDSLFGNEVESSVTVLVVSADLTADRGLVQTEENWQVTSPNGATLYNQSAQVQDTTLCRGRLPGHLLHEWVVVSDSSQPNFDCRGFDAAHDLTP